MLCLSEQNIVPNTSKLTVYPVRKRFSFLFLRTAVQSVKSLKKSKESEKSRSENVLWQMESTLNRNVLEEINSYLACSRSNGRANKASWLNDFSNNDWHPLKQRKRQTTKLYVKNKEVVCRWIVNACWDVTVVTKERGRGPHTTSCSISGRPLDTRHLSKVLHGQIYRLLILHTQLS